MQPVQCTVIKNSLDSFTMQPLIRNTLAKIKVQHAIKNGEDIITMQSLVRNILANITVQL